MHNFIESLRFLVWSINQTCELLFRPRRYQNKTDWANNYTEYSLIDWICKAWSSLTILSGYSELECDQTRVELFLVGILLPNGWNILCIDARIEMDYSHLTEKTILCIRIIFQKSVTSWRLQAKQLIDFPDKLDDPSQGRFSSWMIFGSSHKLSVDRLYAYVGGCAKYSISIWLNNLSWEGLPKLPSSRQIALPNDIAVLKGCEKSLAYKYHMFNDLFAMLQTSSDPDPVRIFVSNLYSVFVKQWLFYHESHSSLYFCHKPCTSVGRKYAICGRSVKDSINCWLLSLT